MYFHQTHNLHPGRFVYLTKHMYSRTSYLEWESDFAYDRTLPVFICIQWIYQRIYFLHACLHLLSCERFCIKTMKQAKTRKISLANKTIRAWSTIMRTLKGMTTKTSSATKPRHNWNILTAAKTRQRRESKKHINEYQVKEENDIKAQDDEAAS